MEFNKFGHTIEFTLHSGSCPPGSTGMMTSDCATWFRIDSGDWFRCDYKSQIKAIKFLEMAENENDLLELIEEIKYNYHEGV